MMKAQSSSVKDEMSKDALDALLSVLDNWAAFFTLLVVIGVGGELVIHVMQSRANKKLIALQRTEALAQEAEIARMKKDSASFELDIAKANKGSADALERASKAEENLENAKKSAADANAKAEGFRLSIAKANESAAQAQAQVAQATAEAAKTNLELAKLKSPRSLTHVPELITALKQFKDIEYRFSAVCPEEECIQLLKQFDGILHDAAWKRGKSVGGFPAINVYGKDADLSVPQALLAGVQISVESPESLSALQSQPQETWPEYVRAAVVLNLSLSTSLSPPQETIGKMVRVDPGTSTSVQISVGKKE